MAYKTHSRRGKYSKRRNSRKSVSKFYSRPSRRYLIGDRF